MKKLLSCKFNMNTACAEIKYEDGTLISTDCIIVENKVTRNTYERLELDYLIYNDTVFCADLVLSGNGANCLSSVTD